MCLTLFAMMEPAKKKKKIDRSKFIVYTDKQIKANHEAGKNKNTTKTEERADRVLGNF